MPFSDLGNEQYVQDYINQVMEHESRHIDLTDEDIAYWKACYQRLMDIVRGARILDH
jgi:hypothetical protein